LSHLKELLAMIDHLPKLLAHAEWADAVFFHTWGKGPARDHEEMRRRVGHLVGVQHGFLAVLRGQPPGAPPQGSPASHDELKTRAAAGHEGLRDFTASLNPGEISRIVQIPWFPDPPCVITVAEALVQVAMHTQHHRGQCMTRLKDFGGEPKNVDWIIWLWKGKPPGRWQ
jgi:uncharacterized damage-inducible protein DinB